MALALAVCLTGLPSTGAQPVSDDYTVGPQDVLSISVFDEPGLSCDCTVGRDGTITFPLLDDPIQVEGLTLRDIQAKITALLRDGYLVNPQVAAEIQAYRSQSVYVLGEVNSPGAYQLQGNLSLINILVQAGGATDQAGNLVQIIHATGGRAGSGPVLAADGDPEVEVTEVSLDDIRTGRLTQVTLRDGDTINVPRAATFYVTGEVQSPGNYVWMPGMTVRQAVALAGGYTNRGSTRGIKILRLVDDETAEIDVDQDDPVLANDTVQVRRRRF